MAAQTDGQGRLCIPKEVREKYGDKYHIVPSDDRIELTPVADDPLTAVRDAAGDLRDAPLEDIQADIDAAAHADAEDRDADLQEDTTK